MAREFDKNMFVMLLAIMIGAIIITYFAADLISTGKLEDLTSQYEGEITSVKSESENFTSSFIKSTVILDQAREDRAFGNYHFDLGLIWYQSALAEKNITYFKIYKERGIDNCTSAMPNYYYSYLNFEDSKDYFNQTIAFASENYLEVLNLYVKLTASGAKLTTLRYDASRYLLYLMENLTFDPINNNVTYLENVTEIMVLFTGVMADYQEELDNYEGTQDEIDEYEFFEEIR